MEDGHTIFDYNVGLNDIVQLLVRQKMPSAEGVKTKDKEAELSDSDSGCGSTQSESDKNSTHGEVEAQPAGTSAQTSSPELIDPGFGFYKVCFQDWKLFFHLIVMHRYCSHPIGHLFYLLGKLWLLFWNLVIGLVTNVVHFIAKKTCIRFRSML